MRRHVFVAHLLGEAVALAPRAAVALDQRRKRTRTFGGVDPRQQRLVAVAEILDFLHVEILGLCIHGVISVWPIFAQSVGRNNCRGRMSPRHRDIGKHCFWGSKCVAFRPTNNALRKRHAVDEVLPAVPRSPDGCRPTLRHAIAGAAGLADPHRQIHRAVRSGRRCRHRRASVRGKAAEDLGPAGRDREPPGRRQHRGDPGIPVGQRRSHLPVRAGRQLCRSSVRLQQAVVRPEGPQSDRARLQHHSRQSR